MRVAGAICASAQIVTDKRIGSDDWLGGLGIHVDLTVKLSQLGK